jgi:putative intracellular protease/amidase
MKKKAYVLIFDGMADWETARALCAINSSGKFDVVATGLTERPVVSMGGLTVEPNTTISDVDPEGTGILILPGGEMWERKSNERVIALIHRLHQEKVPVAAICGATLEIARAGLTLGLRHTSNSRDYLRANVPSYADGGYYVDAPAVHEAGIITAGGLGCVEFAHEITKLLGLHSAGSADAWHDMCKHGVISTDRIRLGAVSKTDYA